MRKHILTLTLIVLVATASVAIGHNSGSNKNYVSAAELTELLKEDGYSVRVYRDGSYEVMRAPVAKPVTTLDPDDVLDAISAARGDTNRNARWDDLLVNSIGDFNSLVNVGQPNAGFRMDTLVVGSQQYFANSPSEVDELPQSPTLAEIESNVRQQRAALSAAGIISH
ncbi:MAG: hypothetical protein JO360_00920 [Acidobacteria bacterium]|nr:hypothetical protein [Acidobacteriota bacterium]